MVDTGMVAEGVHFKRANTGIFRSVLLQLQGMKVSEQCEGGGHQITCVEQHPDRVANALFNED